MAQTLGYLGIANSIAGLIFVHVVYGLAFTTLFFRNFYVTVPSDLTKAARIDGAGFFTIFWRIILPLSPAIIVVSVIWQFTQIWNDFLFGVVFSSGDRQPMWRATEHLCRPGTRLDVHGRSAMSIQARQPDFPILGCEVPTIDCYLAVPNRLLRVLLRLLGFAASEHQFVDRNLPDPATSNVDHFGGQSSKRSGS